MKTTQLVSALGLALTLAAAGGSCVYAEGNTNSQLQAAIKQAENAKNVAKENPSAKYPGIDKYLEKKIAQAEEIRKSGNGDAATMTQVLDEASEATYLLLGTNRTEAKAAATASTMARDNEPVEMLTEANEAQATVVQLAETEVKTPVVQTAEAKEVAAPVVTLANTTVKVTVADGDAEKQDATDEGTDAEVNDGEVAIDDTAETQDEVEVPNTGEKQAGIAELVIAGIAVVLITAGAATMIVKGKRNA